MPYVSQVKGSDNVIYDIKANAANITYDNTLSRLTATNAQNAIDELRGLDPQIKTASGSIASFTDGGDDIPVSEYECEIVAQQASGTPTPDNPLPITGFSQADISVSGKNLFNKATIVNDKVWTGGGEQSASGFFHSDFIKVKPNTTYYSNSNGSGSYYTIYFFDSSKTLLGRADVGAPSAFTTTPDTVWVIMNNNPNNTPLDELQLTEGNTAQAYSAYNGNLYTVAFGQTIYGGRLIYKDGQWSIEATYGVVDLGSLSWSYTPYGYGRFYASMSSVTPSIKAPLSDSDNINALCSISSATNLDNLTSVDTDNIFALGTTKNLSMRCTTYGIDASAFRSALNGIYLYYELETPVIIPITSSTRVKTISGVNNIFSNTGDNSVKYFTDGSDTIVELVEQVSYTKEQTDEAINEVRGTFVTGTLTAGSTSITLSDASITTTSTIDIYTDVFGIQPTNAVVATGTITLTFLAQASDISVKVRVS